MSRVRNLVDFTTLTHDFDGDSTLDFSVSGTLTVQSNTVLSGSYIQLPSITTTERNNISASNGMLIHNSSTGYVEQYLSGYWQAIATGPSIETISPTTFNGDSGSTITINGAAFDNQANVIFIGNDGTEYTASTVSIINSAQITATTPVNFTVANEPYDVKVVNGSGLTAILEDALDAGGLPSWSTASGSLGTFDADDTANITVTAFDPEGGDVDYTLSSGSLPSGLTLNGETGSITGTAPDLDNQTTYNFAITPDDGINNGSSRNFSITVNSGRETYFNLNTLLLSGDNSLEEVTYPGFSDSSGNDHEVVPTGSSYVSEFSPYNTNWAAEFNASEYVGGNTSGVQFGTGDFTLEFWLKKNNGDAQVVFDSRSTTGGSDGFVLTIYNGYKLTYYTAGADKAVDPTPLTIGEWTHFALSRSSGTTRLFRNGTLVSTYSNDTYNYTNNNFRIAERLPSTGVPLNGDISNFRIVKGTALYTSNFTPSTSPLTAVSGTTLLTLHDNRIIDGSSSSVTLTSSATSPKFSSNGPFTETDITSGSGVFPFGSDYVDVSGVSFGSGDFTFELWVYTSDSSDDPIIETRTANNTVGGLTVTAINSSQFRIWDTTARAYVTHPSGSVLNQWNHLCVERVSGTTTFYLNGVAGGTTTAFENLSSTVFRVGQSPYYGSFTGYVADIRLVKGSAVYNGNFTPPTSSLSVSGTELNLMQDRGAIRNIGFIDSSNPGRTITPVSSASSGSSANIDQGAFSPYGNKWSTYFGGDNDYITYTGTALGSGNFTFEAWVFPDENRDNAPWLDNDNGVMFRQHTGGNVLIYDRSVGELGRTTNGCLNLYQWNHVAAVRNNGTIKVYVNGVEQLSVGCSTNFTGTGFYIARFTNASASPTAFKGYISDYRVVVGTAVYTSAFTPPTTALTTISGTTLLTLNSNRLVDASGNVTLNPSGDKVIVTDFSPYYASAKYDPDTHGGSIYFNGDTNTPADDYLILGGYEDFWDAKGYNTFECWIYPTDISVQREIFGSIGGFGDFLIDTDYQLRCHTVNSNYGDTSATVRANEWTHVVLQQTPTTRRIYINGVNAPITSLGGDYAGASWDLGGNMVIGGGTPTGRRSFKGYIADAHVVRGIDKYNSTFTPPTSPITVEDGTALLLNGTNAGIFDSTRIHNVNTTGTARITPVEKKYGTGAIAVNIGGNGVIQIPQKEEFRMNGDWTVEFWINATGYAADGGPYRRVIDFGGGNGTNALQFIVDTGSGGYDADAGAVFPWDGTGEIPNTGDGVTMPSASNGSWHHCAFVKEGTQLRSYQDGNLYTTRTVSASAEWNSPGQSADFTVGAVSTAPTTQGRVNGYIDDLRVSKIVRYTGSSYTVPTKSFKKR